MHAGHSGIEAAAAGVARIAMRQAQDLGPRAAAGVGRGPPGQRAGGAIEALHALFAIDNQQRIASGVERGRQQIGRRTGGAVAVQPTGHGMPSAH